MTVSIEKKTVDDDVVEIFTTDLIAGGGQDLLSWTVPEGVTELEYLIIGGGGAGGMYKGGGGGAGGLLSGTMIVTPGNTLSFLIGAGGVSSKEIISYGANTSALD